MSSWQPAFDAPAADMLARAFAQDPLHRAAFGASAIVPRNRVFFRVALTLLAGRRAVVLDGACVVGFVQVLAPADCRQGGRLRWPMLWILFRTLGVRGAVQASMWLQSWVHWTRRQRPSWYVGPIGVDPEYQRRGIGRALLRQTCEILDAAGAPAVLDTDVEGAVPLYRQHGFEVVTTRRVLGVRVFTMRRQARA